MEKAMVIANPAASQFTGGSHRDVMAILNKKFDVAAIWPASGSEASAAARESVENGAALVVAMGGDGMVHHVAQGVVGTGVRLGVIPVGTTNVVSRLLHLPSNPTKAARLLTAASPPVLAGTARLDITRGSTMSTHHSLFACGLGLDADVVAEADKEPYRKYRFGSLHYASTAFGVAFGSFPKKRPHVTVSSGDRSMLVSAMMLQFRDVYTYFGKLPLTLSDSKPEPMTALLIDRLRRRRVPSIAARVITRRDLEKIPEIEIWEQVDTVVARADPPVAVQADGESLGMADAVTVTWEPESLLLVRAQTSP
ncbi:MAG: diacylglycerol kinase family protein [Acidimicrobiia bacterium]